MDLLNRWAWKTSAMVNSVTATAADKSNVAVKPHDRREKTNEKKKLTGKK